MSDTTDFKRVSRPIDKDFRNDSGFNTSESNDPTVNDNWRESCKAVKDKLQFIFETDLITKDVTFIIGQGNEEIKVSVHSFILSLSSPIFQKLFKYGKTEDHVICLPNTDKTAFNCFLESFYLEEVDISHLNWDALLCLIDLTLKYETMNFMEDCFKELIQLITMDNAMHILEFLLNFKNVSESGKNCYTSCLGFILSNGTEILKSESFLELSEENICNVLKQDELDASEIEIFEATHKWGTAICQKKNLALISVNLRAELKEIIHHIRFPLMSAEDFTLVVSSKGILNAEEKSDILQYISLSNGLKQNFIPALFSSTPRIRRDQISKQVYNEINLLKYNSSMIPQSISDNPTNFTIRNCDLDLNRFLQDFTILVKSKDRRNITSFSLENVLLSQHQEEEKIVKCIRLQNLTSFSLSLICNQDDEDKMRNLIKLQFRRFIFFVKKAKHYPWPSPSSYLWSFQADIFLSLNGIVFLKVDHQIGSIVINQLIAYPVIINCLKACDELKSLAISFESTRLASLSVVESVESLILHNMEFLLNPIPYVTMFPNLIELVMYRCSFLKINIGSLIPFLPNLKKLSISQATLNGFKMLGYGMNSLESLTLWNCSWDEQFETNFDQMFPALSESCLINSVLDRPLYKIMYKLLHMRNLKRATITGFVWGIRGPHVRNYKDDDIDFTTIRNILHRIGTRKNLCRVSISKTEPNVDAGIELQDGLKVIINQINERKVSEIMFHHFRFDQFYSDFETYILKHEE